MVIKSCIDPHFLFLIAHRDTYFLVINAHVDAHFPVIKVHVTTQFPSRYSGQQWNVQEDKTSRRKTGIGRKKLGRYAKYKALLFSILLQEDQALVFQCRTRVRRKTFKTLQKAENKSTWSPTVLPLCYGLSFSFCDKTLTKRNSQVERFTSLTLASPGTSHREVTAWIQDRSKNWEICFFFACSHDLSVYLLSPPRSYCPKKVQA